MAIASSIEKSAIDKLQEDIGKFYPLLANSIIENSEVIAKCDNLFLSLLNKDRHGEENKGGTGPDEIILSKIFLIRDKKVMLDRDLAELYGVTTFRLNEQVKRNKKRFPEDFMFRLTKAEKQALIDNNEQLNTLKYSPALPNVFTEHGAVMLASVLNSERAIEANIQIVRIFTRLRELVVTHKDILLQLEKLEQKVTAHDQDIQLIFEYLKQLLNPPQEPRPRIGYRRSDEQA